MGILNFKGVCVDGVQYLWCPEDEKNTHQWTVVVTSLVPLPFLNPAWISGSSRFTYCWSLAWKILSISLLVSVQLSSVAQSCLTFRDPMNRSTPGLPAHQPTPGVYPNSCILSQWCHPTISSSVIPFSSCIQSLPMSQFFALSVQSIGVSASTSVLPVNTQDWSALGWTGWISLQSKGLYRHALFSPPEIIVC